VLVPRWVRFALAAATAFTLVGTSEPLSAAAPKPSTLCGLEHVGGSAATTSVPVVLIHGINSSPSVWSPAMDKALGTVPGVGVYTYDYSTHSLDAFNSPRILDPLVNDLDCLASTTHQQIAIVAHSMGGLLIQAAQAQIAHIGLVTTIGTPVTGASLDQDVRFLAVAYPELIPVFTVCGLLGHAHPNPPPKECGLLAVPDSAAGRSMLPQSPELIALQPGPTTCNFTASPAASSSLHSRASGWVTPWSRSTRKPRTERILRPWLAVR
jgi:pimeloyl-ACP methyl ester carboxylesterase